VKLAHIADPHLGVRQYHRQTAAGINQREADVANAFRAAVDGVVAAGPDAVVVAGDLFHAVRPTNAAIVFAFREFQRLREALPHAPIVLIAGNHDTPRSSETGSILRLFAELGIDVAVDEPRRLEYADLDLSVLAVPHAALVGDERPSLRPSGSARRQVLLVHGEVEGVVPGDRAALEYGGAPLTPSELGFDAWSYIALGHYHVRHRVAPRVWYAGALEYVSSNLWGELADEARLGVREKAWLLVDVDGGVVEPRTVASARSVLDLEPVHAAGLDGPGVDRAIAERIRQLPGGIADRIVRLRVYDIERHVARSLDHAAIREWKSEALHFNLDLRRPEVSRTVGVGAPGHRQTLPELVRGFLEKRPLPAEIDRTVFVHTGTELMDAVERDAGLTG
jgi:DNA repair exonuclease SbcCD nuclease subunit